MSRLILSLSLVAALITASYSLAEATCTDSPGYYCCLHDGFPIDDVPIVLNENLVRLCDASLSTCNTKEDVEREIRAVLTDLYTASGGVLRPYIHSWSTIDTTPEGPDPITGKVHVYALVDDPACKGVGGFGFGVPGIVDSGGNWTGHGYVELCANETYDEGVTYRDVPFAAANARGGRKSLRAFFSHELGHALGQAHLHLCAGSQSVRGLMASGGTEVYPSSNFMEPFIRWVRDLHGLRWDKPRMFYSEDGNSYTDLSSNIPSSMWDTLTRFSASNSVGGSTMWVGWRNLAGLVKVAYYTGSTWSVLGSGLGLQWGQYLFGVATKNTASAAFAAQVHWEQPFNLTDVRMRSTVNYGSTWSLTSQVSDPSTIGRTAAPGVAMTYDPVSAQYITLYRLAQLPSGPLAEADENVIAYRLANESSPGKLAGMTARDTPSLACGPSSVGTDNCLLAYTSDNDWGGGARWHHCRVSGGALVCGPERYHPYMSAGTPSVTYTGNSSYPWNLVLTQGGASIFSWRKTAIGTSFVDQRSQTQFPQLNGPTIGTRSASNGRRYIMSMGGN